jgi:hypothetical protein
MGFVRTVRLAFNWWINPRALLGLLVVCAAVAWTMVLLI